MSSPYKRITSCRLAAAKRECVVGRSLGAGRLVIRYQVVTSGKVCGSVGATTARSTLTDHMGPASISSTHQSCVLPSRARPADTNPLARLLTTHPSYLSCHVLGMRARDARA